MENKGQKTKKQIVKKSILGFSEYKVDSINPEKLSNIKPMINCNGTIHDFRFPIFFEYLHYMENKKQTRHRQLEPRAFSLNMADYTA